ncbi:hypothetical protein HCH_06921 [Hahella chejuensis KCTC 2396]|uniref:Uncharacterized protein n=1 Tax=Hahella chejuensis (strain KCTC 2396) TaxID=349521 RepID=Q2S736_HAHCH|nr:hypothetical protein [Hahella chejuensis]ABC33538.1 hypothetical protein HCH_06921 [Hahella chejuensis KCTC 2396]
MILSAKWLIKHCSTLGVLTLSLFVVGCATQSASTNSATAETDIAGEYPSRPINEFAKQLRDLLNLRNTDKIVDMVDMKELLDKAVDRSDLPVAFRPSAKSRLIETQLPNYRAIVAGSLLNMQTEAGYYEIASIAPEQSQITYRLDDEALGYLTVYYRRDASGEYRITDLHNWLSVYDLSYRIAQGLSLSYRINLQGNRAKQALLLQLGKVSKSDDVAEIHRVFEGLADERRNDDYLQLLYAESLLNAGDLAGFVEQTAVLNERLGTSPNYQWLLYYRNLNLENYQAAAEHLQAQIEQTGLKDAGVLDELARIKLLSEQYDEAIRLSYEAILSDSYYEPSYSTLTFALIKTDRLDTAWETLKVLKERFSYEFDEAALRENGRFGPLLEREDFRNWLKQS